MARSLSPIPLLALLATLLSGCGDPPAQTPVSRIDLRPAWQEGDAYLLREVREERIGTGPFPAEGEVLARTRRLARLTRNYRVEILDTDGERVRSARFTYRTSAEEKDGTTTPDALAGNSYLVTRPFGEMRVEGEVAGAGTRGVEPREAAMVRSTALRMAASLLPDEPVDPDDTWAPGRDLDVFRSLGKGPIRMVPRLREIGRIEDRRFAVIGCETEARVTEGPRANSRLGMKETLHLDLDDSRIESYHARAEWRIPRGPERSAEWRRTTVDLSIQPE